jgi:3-(3-hydroxy-phenyl)propionate hydroxylase
VFPRELEVSHGAAGRHADPAAWTLGVLTRSQRWLSQVTGLTEGRPMIRVVRLDPAEAGSALGCRSTGFYLIRPDGHLAAHGHQHDLDRLLTELNIALTPGELQ